MKEMDNDGIKTYQKIKELKTVNTEQVLMMQQFTRDYIDPKCTICRTCPAQIRFAWNRIINWANKNKIENITPQSDVKLCECGAPLKDKRRKKCDDCKK